MTNNENFLKLIGVHEDEVITHDYWDSGSSVYPNPYLRPVVKGHEFDFLFTRCRYCGVTNHSTEPYCFGCGAPL